MQSTFSQSPSAAVAGLVRVDQLTLARILASRQLEQLTFGTTDGTYTVTIDGVVSASFVASSSTAALERADIKADIEASAAAAKVTVENSSTDKLLIEARGYGDDDDFTISISTVTTYALAHLVAHQEEVPFGYGVCMDDREATSGTQCRLPRQATDVTAKFLGVAVADTGLQANVGGWATGSSMRILRLGQIYIYVEGTIGAGAPVYCRYDASSSGALGAFRIDGDSSTAGLVPGMRTLEGRTGAGIVLAELT